MNEVNLFLCILIGMTFCHILDDFVLQTICLSQLKQKKTWEKYCNGDEKLLHQYRNDYKMALGVHSVSWAIAIILPWLFIYGEKIGLALLVSVIINSIIHYVVDDLKANKGKLNLVTDQSIHFAQIVITWIIFIILIKCNVV